MKIQRNNANLQWTKGDGCGFACVPWIENGQDANDGEQCLNVAKSKETLVEARSDTDVTIVRYTWVCGAVGVFV